MPATEPGKIRNIAVVGHRGVGKTSLAEAMLFQAGKINRLGTVEQGTTASDWDDGEQRRGMSLSGSLIHLDWHDRKINLIDCPGDAGFQADTFAALRVVEGALVVAEWGDGRRGQHVEGLGALGGVRVVARRLREHARSRARRLLSSARRCAGAALRSLRCDPAADRCRARADGRRRPAAHVRVHGSLRRQGGWAAADSRFDGRAGAGVPREAPRRRRRDERGLDGALPRRRGSAGRGRRARVEGCGDT